MKLLIVTSLLVRHFLWWLQYRQIIIRVYFLWQVSLAAGGSVSGNGTVWCEGLMMVPWQPCDPFCENESAYCSPGGVNQKYAVEAKLDNGSDIFVSAPIGYSYFKGFFYFFSTSSFFERSQTGGAWGWQNNLSRPSVLQHGRFWQKAILPGPSRQRWTLLRIF